MRKTRDYILLILKGMGMGASDVVPGVSGGTIAFISGIYEELLNSIKSINATSISQLLKFRIGAFWNSINGWFLAAVFGGVLLSVFSLSHILEYLLEHKPVLIWSFFFGLVVASAYTVLAEIRGWKWHTFLALFIGIAVAWWITSITPAQTPTGLWFIFISGVVAICAMILPGISGSFILLLMGKYQYILSAVSNLNLLVLLVFTTGCVTGLIAFSNVLSWLLRKFHNFTVAVLAGFMIGSLNKIWPWKATLSTFTDRHGVEHPLIQENILPSGTDSDLLSAILLCLAGALLIIGLNKVSEMMKK